MKPFVPIVASAIVLTGCARTTVGWRPTLVSQVVDSTRVRAASSRDAPVVAGRSLDWQRGSPRIVTSAGDTVVVPRNAVVSVQLPGKTRHAGTGAVVGALIGIFGSLGACSEYRCEEGNPYQLGGAVAGALIGYAIRTDHWVRVAWDRDGHP